MQLGYDLIMSDECGGERTDSPVLTLPTLLSAARERGGERGRDRGREGETGREGERERETPV